MLGGSLLLKVPRMAELAFDLVMEILAKVPVKDLLRFRCVCKSWRSLFQDERFIRMHTTHAPSTFLLSACWPRIHHRALVLTKVAG
ncbi:unnamed protein product [Arabidopsis thaliana]|uniref:F-box domain-containing protein n=1 Tax=Arabidopsis thaliana TaxID=3702 RepID=A0A654F0W4_ARATH|nr:unnamed protein product [Arabidopsis thaliana]